MNKNALKPQLSQVDGKWMNFVKVGSGPPIVFVHGWCNNWLGWMPIVPYLRKRFSLYLIDLLGFGDSDDLDSYSVQKEAMYLADFVKLLPQKPVTVVGLSMGSFIVAEMGKRYPQCTNSVTLVGPVIKKRRMSDAISIMIRYALKGFKNCEPAELVLKRVIDTNTASYLTSKYLNMYRFDKELIDSYGIEGKLKMRKEAFTQLGISASCYDLKNVLIDYQMPVLLIYGREDKVSKAAYARTDILPKNLNVTACEIPKAGHVASFEKPAEAASAISDFISTLKLSRAGHRA